MSLFTRLKEGLGQFLEPPARKPASEKYKEQLATLATELSTILKDSEMVIAKRYDKKPIRTKL